MLGAFSGQLADRFGNRIIVIVGAVFIFIGFLLGSFSESLWHLYLTQGLIAGIGFR